MLCHKLPSPVFLFLLFRIWFVATTRSSIALLDTKSDVFPRRYLARLQVVNRDSIGLERAVRAW